MQGRGPEGAEKKEFFPHDSINFGCCQKFGRQIYYWMVSVRLVEWESVPEIPVTVKV